MFYKAADNMLHHDGVEQAGYLSFMILLTFFPFLVFFVAILGAIGEGKIGNEFIQMIIDNAPQRAVEAILPRIKEITSGPPIGLFTVVLAGTVWTSSSIVEGIRTVLNRAYHVHSVPNFFFRRLTSIGQILLLTIILIVAMLGLVILPPIINQVYGLFFTVNTITNQQQTEALQGLAFLNGPFAFFRYIFAFLILIGFISTIYYVLPNVKQKWRYTLPGALITCIGWALAANLFTYYLLHFAKFNVVYGSLGSIIAFLLFFYIINMIFIYGAEFNYLMESYLGLIVGERKEVAPENIKRKEQLNHVVNQNEIVKRH